MAFGIPVSTVSIIIKIGDGMVVPVFSLIVKLIHLKHYEYTILDLSY